MANPSNMAGTGKLLRVALLLTAGLLALPAWGDTLEFSVKGVEEPLLSNVESRITPFRVAGNNRLSRRRLAEHQEDAERRATSALRPFGYYHAQVDSELVANGDTDWKIILRIEKGPPVLISSLSLEITGPGQNDPGLQSWLSDWPMKKNDVLNQATWEEQKATALTRAEEHGYLNAAFSQHVIELDLEQNRADIRLLLETGEQAVMGSIVFEQDLVNPAVLENIPRFNQGQPYDAWLMEQLRLDLWRAGYFNYIEVVEERRLEESPPRVNLLVKTEARKRNTYQGSVGYGTDTGPRLQAIWARHLLSSRGDSMSMSLGWQQQYNEVSFRTTYRLPRKVPRRQYWTAELAFKSENQSFKVRPSGSNELITLARGNVDDYAFKPGLLNVRGLKRGYQQVFELWYVQYLRERANLTPVDEVSAGFSGRQIAANEFDQLSRDNESLSLGVSWNWPVVRGSGFETVGHNHKARVFTSNTAWGSDIDFTQLYISSKWNTIWHDRWKFLLRGEVGYSDARVYEQFVQVGDELIELSVTELPSAYRFKAGGSQSVRGYGFENLSNNNVGSNNIVTASAELELRFREDWSAAVFFDLGNAFNDWDSTTLKKGAGAGIRWYSIAGPMRLDFARAINEPDQPWRIHFTIGTPLL
jgi:translocation and assembly module TamA